MILISRLKVRKIKPIYSTQSEKNGYLTPEEWVRQHCIQFLLKTKKVPLVYSGRKK